MEYEEISRSRKKNGVWSGVLKLIPDLITFPDGIPYDRIEVLLWNMEELRESAVEAEYQRRADKMKDKFLEIPERKLKYYTDEEVEEILKKKKYFTSDEIFPDDLPDKPIKERK